jgi:hypothetical protein
MSKLLNSFFFLNTVVFVCLFCAEITYAQVHYEDPNPTSEPFSVIGTGLENADLNATDISVSNLGSFVVNGPTSRVRIFGNVGNVIAETDKLDSYSYGKAGCIAIATNHNSDIAIISTGAYYNHSNYQTQLQVQILSNSPDKGNLNLAKPFLLKKTLPLPFMHPLPSPDILNPVGPFVQVMNTQATMDKKYVYITWRQINGEPFTAFDEANQTGIKENGVISQVHYGFAIFDFTTSTWIVKPMLLKDPNGNYATGSTAPTVACDRWNDGLSGNRTHQPEVAFSYIDHGPSHNAHAAVVRPYYIEIIPQLPAQPYRQWTVPDAVNLPEPVSFNGFERCIWVSVANFDEFEGVSKFHYFYAYYNPDPNDPGGININSKLYSTDGNILTPPAAASFITDRLPASQWILSGSSPVITSVIDTAAPACGNGYTESAVYLSYVTDQLKRTNATMLEPFQELNICRQNGTSPLMIYPTTVGRTSDVGNYFLNYTVGANQMGVYVTHTTTPLSNKVTKFIRFKRPFAQHVRENTLVTGNCELQPNQFHRFGGELGIWVMPSETAEEKADTLRILGENIDQGVFGQHGWVACRTYDPGFGLLKYTTPTLGICPTLIAGVPFDAPTSSAQWSNGRRGCVIIDPRIVEDIENIAYLFKDNGFRIDFNNVHGSIIGVAHNGSIEFGQSWVDNYTNVSGVDQYSAVFHKADPFTNMNFTFIDIQGNHNVPDTIEKYRGLAYFNMPITLANGSNIRCIKGQIRFQDKDPFGQGGPLADGYNPNLLNEYPKDMSTIFANGNASITFDTTIMYLGSRQSASLSYGFNKTYANYFLHQIIMNPNYDAYENFHNPGQYFTLTNSIVSTGWENLHDYNTIPTGYSTGIILNGTTGVIIRNNLLCTTFFDIKNPYYGVNFDNNVIYDVRYMLHIGNTEEFREWLNGDANCDIEIKDNIVRGNFHQVTANTWQDEAVDFSVTNVREILNGVRSVEISGNRIIGNNNSNSSNIPFQANWTGIQIDRGSVANVVSNTISDIGIGIYHEGLQLYPSSFICSNEVSVCCPNSVVNAGIVEDDGMGITKLNYLHNNRIGYQAQQHDQSVFLRNFLIDNVYGAKFVDNASTILNGIHNSTESIAGMNEFDNNINLSGGAGSLAQIHIQSSTAIVNPQPLIGLISLGTDDGTWGQNKFTSNQSLPLGSSGHIVHILYEGTTPTAQLDNSIQLNDWSPGLLTSSSLISASQDQMVVNLAHLNEANKTATLSDLQCSEINGYQRVIGKNPGLSAPYHPASVCDISADDSLYLYVRSCYCWKDVDARKALDTCRLYVERHPYATQYPGQVLSAIGYAFGFVGQLPNISKKDWIDSYNWFIKILSLNSEDSYQFTVLETMADNLGQIDLNASANLWWNISLLYPDTGTVSRCWKNIISIRKYQAWIPQDTTPFHKLTFPLEPLSGGSNAAPNIQERLNLSINPNPAKDNALVTFELPDRKEVKISLYDILGKEIKKVSNSLEDKGLHTKSIAVTDITPGTYFVRMEYTGGVLTKSLIVEH